MTKSASKSLRLPEPDNQAPSRGNSEPQRDRLSGWIASSLNFLDSLCETFGWRLSLDDDDKEMSSEFLGADWKDFSERYFELKKGLDFSRLDAEGYAKYIDGELENVALAYRVTRYYFDIAIDEDSQSKIKPLTVSERWEHLSQFAKRGGSASNVAMQAKLLFGDIAAQWEATQSDLNSQPAGKVILPVDAPERYQGLRGPESPPAFVQRVYGEWLGHGLTRAHIRQLDPTLYQAIVNWTRKPENEWPSDVDLPTLKEQNDRDIARLNAGEGQEILGKFTGKEAARLGAAISRRVK